MGDTPHEWFIREKPSKMIGIWWGNIQHIWQCNLLIWEFPSMGVPLYRWIVYWRIPFINRWELGVPLILGNPYIHQKLLDMKPKVLLIECYRCTRLAKLWRTKWDFMQNWWVFYGGWWFFMGLLLQSLEMEIHRCTGWSRQPRGMPATNTCP